MIEDEAPETPAETYERLFKRKWPGGRAPEIFILRKILNINYSRAGTPDGDAALQIRLLAWELLYK